MPATPAVSDVLTAAAFRPETAKRTDVILDAVRRALLERRTLFDAALDLGEVTVCVKLHAGTNVVKALVVTDERVRRRA